MSKLRALLPPIAASLLVIGIAPFTGLLVDATKRALPRGFVPLMAVSFGGAVLVLLFWISRKIRDRRASRCTLVGLGVLLMALQVFGWNRGSPAEDAVERVHLLLYGAIALLLYRVLGRPPQSQGILAVPSTLAACALVGVLDETVQRLVAVRTGDVFDVALNAYAGLCGVLVGLGLFGLPAPGQALASSRRALGWLLAVLTLAFGVFFHLAHLGYRIGDPEIGTFYSYRRAEALLAANPERALRWAEHSPGPPFGPLEPEDRFMTEAGWHVHWRNNALERRETAAAFRENQILEKYFWAFLDLKREDGQSRHRIPAEAQGPLHAGAPPYTGHPGPPAARPGQPPGAAKRIYDRPSKPVFWSVIGLLIASSIAIGYRSSRRALC